VTATNAVGTGASSGGSNAVTPNPGTAVPGAPTTVLATAGPLSGQASVNWNAPVNTGNLPLIGYTVTSDPTGITASASGSATAVTVTGLSNGIAYTFTVIAANTAGAGLASVQSNAVTPTQYPGSSVPGSPTGVTAQAGNGQATVSWTAPDNGGQPITGYTVTSSPGSFTAQAGAGATSATVTNLQNGTSYTFTITASNAVGAGVQSAASNAVTPNLYPGSSVPGSPTGVVATPSYGQSTGQATVTWTAPTSDGNQTISGYLVTASPSGFTAQASGVSATSAAVLGLADGTSYTFTVMARNAVGASAPSAPSSAVTPEAYLAGAQIPGAPTAVTAFAGNGHRRLSVGRHRAGTAAARSPVTPSSPAAGSTSPRPRPRRRSWSRGSPTAPRTHSPSPPATRSSRVRPRARPTR